MDFDQALPLGSSISNHKETEQTSIFQAEGIALPHLSYLIRTESIIRFSSGDFAVVN